MLSEKAPAAWVQFRDAIASHTQSHNETTEGTHHPVIMIADPEGDSLVLERHEGLMKDATDSLTLTVSIAFERAEHAITALKERWITRDGSRVRNAEQSTRYTFAMELSEADPPVVQLRHGEESKEPAAAAEMFLLYVLAPPTSQLIPHY